MEKLILITNPGSASRKYALYSGEELVATLHFEYEKDKVVCTLKDADGKKRKIPVEVDDLGDAVSKLHGILEAEGYVTDKHPLGAILARVAAPGEYWTSDHKVDDECMRQLEIAKRKAPLHVPVVAAEINHFRHSFSTVPIIAVSDSGFHADKPDLMKYYCFDTELADKTEVKRYGYHGLSVGYVTEYMREAGILPEKLVVCHIGSGSSITAVYEGRSMDTSMGYSPLEGLMMSTRAGSMDVVAALAIKTELGLDDEELEKYLNKKSGLLGVSGESDDMREIVRLRDEGDKRATMAHALYIYRVQAVIGQMVASMGGVDAIAFTATIGERGYEIRHDVCQKLGYLGFDLDVKKNDKLMWDESGHVNVGTTSSKPIYVLKTNEMAEMIRRATLLLG